MQNDQKIMTSLEESVINYAQKKPLKQDLTVSFVRHMKLKKN